MKSKVLSVETAKKELLIENPSRSFKKNSDKLLLANGAHPFVTPIKGVKKNGILLYDQLKTFLQ